MKIDRLMGILTLLLEREKITATVLAQRFEVSRRTILRDIDTLCKAGIPVITEQGSNGGISIAKGYKIQKSVLTADELQSLVSALKGLDSVSKSSNFENLMLKLAPDHQAVVSLGDSIVIDLSSHYKDSLSEKIALIKQAVAERRLLCFDYYYSKGESRRQIEPYFMEFRWNAWYVFGWCCERREFRRFKLNRLWALSLMQDTYQPRSVVAEKAAGADAFFSCGRMEVLFDRSVRYRLIEAYGLDCYKETPQGLLLFLDYTNQDYIFSWLLGFGDKAEVLSPPEMRRAFGKALKKAAAKYPEI